MKRRQRWQSVFLIWPHKVSGKWCWLRRVMRKGDQYMLESEYDDMVSKTEPSPEDLAKLTPYADELLEEDYDGR